MRLSLMLPYPPSVNAYWRAVNGRVIVSAKGAQYRWQVQELVAGERRGGTLPGHALIGHLAVYVYVYPPDSRVRDIDNVLKATLDAMTAAGIYIDDSQVDELHVVRAECVNGGALGVQIEEMEEAR